MNKPMHQFSDLFAQLGLPNDDLAIQHFLASHAPCTAISASPKPPSGHPPKPPFYAKRFCRILTGWRWSTSSVWRCGKSKSRKLPKFASNTLLASVFNN